MAPLDMPDMARSRAHTVSVGKQGQRRSLRRTTAENRVFAPRLGRSNGAHGPVVLISPHRPISATRNLRLQRVWGEERKRIIPSATPEPSHPASFFSLSWLRSFLFPYGQVSTSTQRRRMERAGTSCWFRLVCVPAPLSVRTWNPTAA